MISSAGTTIFGSEEVRRHRDGDGRDERRVNIRTAPEHLDHQ